MKLGPLSLLSKIWLSTSFALTVLFAITGYMLQRHALGATTRSLEAEVKASFGAYESVWQSRAEKLGSVAGILSSMPNVRGAFSTGDQAAIRDTAGELWLRISDRLKETAFFLVADSEGKTIASLDNRTPAAVPQQWPVVRDVRPKFPRQVAGFIVHQGQLFQLVLTPVYAGSGRGAVLINVLVAGYTVNHLVAQELKESTGASEFVFFSRERVFASTLNDRATAVLSARAPRAGRVDLVSDGVSEYVALVRELIDPGGKPVGTLGIFRSFEGARQSVDALRRDIVLFWGAAMSVGLWLTWLLARRIVRPVDSLDRAAAEVARQNYDYRVPVNSRDELGRLASTFNSMCASLQRARQELIRHERISTIGRLAGSIVHDLRNPLAAIYGGAEMLVDTDLAPAQVKRLAGNIYRASRRIQEMLQELLDVSRGRAEQAELCKLREVIQAAVDAMRPTAEAQSVRTDLSVPADLELPMERARMERVFVNLIVNSLEAMPGGGSIRIAASVDEKAVTVSIEDTGPGVSGEIRGELFQPFASFGKKSGLGLGLALSRETALDHGGDIWADAAFQGGARFCVRLPLARGETAVAEIPPV
ncbi:MAG: ATP-binding protein [Bryobacterales bacterium]|nr:ATP-binding protein [Bryobacterales bacterium]